MRSFQALMALVKSLRVMRALILELAAPGRGVQSRSRRVSVSRKVPGGILISVPSGRWEVLKLVSETPTSDSGYTVKGVPAAELKWSRFRLMVSLSTSSFSV